MAIDVGSHPAWCDGSATVDCGTHLSAPVDVPATAGRWRCDSAGAAFPFLRAAASLDETSTPGVLLAMFDPTGDADQALEVVATPAEARRYAAAIVAQADLAESGHGPRLRVA